ncbi:M18 family aminopeptidase [Marinobacter lutaoensis]|jgi:aspartyl aminopeptidase|uniref:M18 family aminopeptidase n=1 Tax=Marinobacter lutaoensis TaxID=135739 RepID=A0A1V2DU81_9GAMM|nr:M18 family aminopeptidase [Marinobacter lutaoensis]MBE03130.1 M18 family aminopeptidase [Marinobacter sp.]MBI42066.1 M18 family aminopeptidase [Oceanospirillales bacterium]NVD36184.1 M18 family aminopeptidase [Marinobacter lutaoensis]ONF43936.1 M18 family aminopeptidase [Marinobacter lutaoensis]|tara:strand:+ start:1759 stop:3048 length:1290 start_codon:yes stop_codon:yes gene_type:complete
MEHADFNQGLLEFLNQSPTPWHAVATMKAKLDEAGFQALDEREDWSLAANSGYYVIRNGSSLVAFRTGTGDPAAQGVRMVGAHTDSPCLKVKPNPVLRRKGYFQLGVEVYGGALLNPWFDRDLSLAGRVTLQEASGQVRDVLVNFRRPVAFIPSLAIHLDREANSNRSVNPQTDLPPVLMQAPEGDATRFEDLLERQVTEETGVCPRRILGYELSLYDTQKAGFVGLHGEFIASARMDNLLSCYIGLQSLIHTSGEQPALLVCNDHEEVGSMSAEGAQGPFLSAVLDRWLGAARGRALARSMMISADNAHGVHPNYLDRHDENHGPILNRGPVIKVNHNQRYATNSRSAALYRLISDELGLPHQTFVVRSDMACGSTIGPLTAANLGVTTLDIGVPQFGMHSIRELIGAEDGHTLFRVLVEFLQRPVVL